jgi:hypothetical protein
LETDINYRAEETLAVQCHPEQAEALVTEIIDAGERFKRAIGLRSATHQQPQNDALKPTLRRARGQSGRMTASKILALSRAHSSAILTLAAALDSNSVDFSDELLTDTGEGKLIPTPINISKRIEVA